MKSLVKRSEMANINVRGRIVHIRIRNINDIPFLASLTFSITSSAFSSPTRLSSISIFFLSLRSFLLRHLSLTLVLISSPAVLSSITSPEVSSVDACLSDSLHSLVLGFFSFFGLGSFLFLAAFSFSPLLLSASVSVVNSESLTVDKSCSVLSSITLLTSSSRSSLL